jgi:hypothetical protein
MLATDPDKPRIQLEQLTAGKRHEQAGLDCAFIAAAGWTERADHSPDHNDTRQAAI